jgi:hypothetical protein
MLKLKIFVFGFSILFYLKGWSDVIPRDSGVVHYIHVYFEEGFQKNASKYELQVYSDSLSLARDQASYSLTNTFPAFRLNLDWDKTYFWRVRSYDKKNKLIANSALHRFIIVTKVNSSLYDNLRMDVRINKTDKHAGGYFMIDYLSGIYDRSGKPLWLLPPIPGYVHKEIQQIRDLKFTRDGTITFLSDNHPIEIDLEGNILWSLPNPFVFKNDTITFHHDLKKTKQGTYMIMGNKFVYRKLLVEYTEELQKTKREVKMIDGKVYGKTELAIILELDKTGNVLWYWDANDYFTDEDLNYKKTPEGYPLLAVHANAIGIDEANTKLYVGFRNINRIIKIDKQSKKVELSYGEKYPSGDGKYGNNLFRQQHDANVTNRNSILILNNNGARKTTAISSIMELKDNVQPGDSVLLWQFDLNFDTLTNGRTNSSGNVVELPNGNLFLCAGQLNRLFEVTRDKEVVWDAFTYALMKRDSVWRPLSNYRGSWVKEIALDHILAEVISVKKQKDNILTIELSVYNVNERDEAYTIEILAGGNASAYKVNTKKINKNTHVTEKLNIPITESLTKTLTLRISSVKNKLIVKNINLDLNSSLVK